MKPSLTAGLAGAESYAVTDDMAPPHLPVAVLSTPSMVLLIEAACLALAQSHLDDGEVTVGTHICVSHLGAAMVGESVDVRCTLEAVEKRRLTFNVVVEGKNGLISDGTHQRAVVDSSRFG